MPSQALPPLTEVQYTRPWRRGESYRLREDDPQARGLIGWWPDCRLDYTRYGVHCETLTNPFLQHKLPHGMLGCRPQVSAIRARSAPQFQARSVFTVTLWFQPWNITTASGLINKTGNSTARGFHVVATSAAGGSLTFRCGGSGTDLVVSYAFTMFENYFVAVACPGNSSELIVWINGERFTGGLSGANVNINGGDRLGIGQAAGGFNNLAGLICDVRYYDYVKADSEILDIYGNPTRLRLPDRDIWVPPPAPPPAPPKVGYGLVHGLRLNRRALVS